MRHRDDPPSTYHQMVGIDDPLPQGRFRGVEPRHHVGKAPIEAPPRISHGPWATPDGVPNEEPLGVDIDAIDIGGSPPSQSAASLAATVGDRSPAAPASSPVERGLRHLQRRA
jgi:hypothetical protein